MTNKMVKPGCDETGSGSVTCLVAAVSTWGLWVACRLLMTMEEKILDQLVQGFGEHSFPHTEGHSFNSLGIQVLSFSNPVYLRGPQTYKLKSVTNTHRLTSFVHRLLAAFVILPAFPSVIPFDFWATRSLSSCSDDTASKQPSPPV